MASLTWWTWAWVNSGSWGWTERPGVLQSLGSKESDMTELNWTEYFINGSFSFNCYLLDKRTEVKSYILCLWQYGSEKGGEAGIWDSADIQQRLHCRESLVSSGTKDVGIRFSGKVLCIVLSLQIWCQPCIWWPSGSTQWQVLLGWLVFPAWERTEVGDPPRPQLLLGSHSSDHAGQPHRAL